MPQLIEVPGQGIVEFPDGMSDEDIAGAIKRNGQIQLLNPTESIQTPLVGMGQTGGVQGLMNPVQLAGVQPMQGMVPPVPQPSGSLQQYIGLNQQRQQIEASALDERSKIHSYPFVDLLQQKLGYNPTAFTGQVDPSKFQPLFPQDPVQKEILAEIEQKRVEDLAKLAALAQQQGFEKTPGTEYPDITKPLMSFGIRPNTVQKALGTGDTASKVISGVQQAAAGVPETFSSPLGMAAIPGTMPKLVGQTIPKLVTGGFVADMTAHLPEQAKMAKDALEAGDTEGAARALGSIALTGLMLGKEAQTYGPKVGKAFRENTPITPEVMPKQDRPIGPERQLGEQPAIDVETVGPAQITQARRFYQTESRNPPVDASQLTQRELGARLEANKPLEQLPAKRTYEGGPVVIGENQPQNIAKSLGVRYDGKQEMIPGQPKEVYTSLNPDNPFTVYVEVGAPKAEVQARLAEKQQTDVTSREVKGGLVVPSLPNKPLTTYEGGKISFSSPAESGAIPSARQSGLAGDAGKAIPPQEPQIGQGAIQKGEPIKDSQPKSKSPINESIPSDSINESNKGQMDYNTGPLTRKQQEWLVASAKKLLNSPKDLRYSPDRKGEYDGGQLVARLMNNIPQVEKEMLEKAGIKEQFKAGQKVSKEQVEKWIDDNGPKVEVHSYGMEGKVSEARKEYDKMTHEWYDNLSAGDQQNVTYLGSEHNDAAVKSLKNAGWTDEKINTAIKYNEMGRKTGQEPKDSSPRATSAYDSVSAFPTTEPMPDWTTSKEGKNVQRVDVVLPVGKVGDNYQRFLKESGMKDSDEAVSFFQKNKETGQIKWSPDNLHENLPNTLGWAMIQYKTGLKGEKIAFIAEAQSRWGQEIRAENERHEKQVQKHLSNAFERDGNWYSKLEQNTFGYGKNYKTKEDLAVGLREGLIKTKTQSHPLLRDYNRLILKAAIEQARKEGATDIVVSDSKTALMTEQLDTRYQEFATKDIAEHEANKTSAATGKNWNAVEHGGKWYITEHEKGFDFAYDTSLPRIAEELTGNKGERIELGEHKNAFKDKVSQDERLYETHGMSLEERNQYYRDIRGPRENLIFRNPDGTPKTFATGLMFPLNKVSQASDKAPFTITGSDRLKEEKTADGKIEYYHSGIPITKETLEAVKDLLRLPGKALNLYAEPIVEKLGRVGGPVAKKATEEFQRMISRQKQVYGELSPVVDAAKKATGRMASGNIWLRRTNEITNKAAVNNFFASNEGGTTPPSEARQAVQALDRANIAIGKSATLANPDFVPTGKLQRVLTNYGYDVIRRGNGPAWEAWTAGVAKANNVNPQLVKDFFSKWKDELDKPASDIASMDRISQDFSRKFPKTVTHIKPGVAWHEIVVADPYNYIESAAQRTSHAVAFREVYPLVRDDKGNLGPSGYLQATRKAIQKELNTAGFDANLFDNLVSAVQGHPLDTFTKGWNAPDSLVGAGYRMGQQLVGQPLKSLMLTANTVSNLGEVMTGGPAIFLGYHNVVPAMKALAKDRSLEKYLEFIGARNQSMYNWSVDPTSPVRSGSRLLSNALRFGTAQQWLNEIQESTGAMGAKFVADRILNKELTQYESDRVMAVARVMGMTKEQADKMVKGDKDLLRQFETKAAAFLTAGNQAMAEKSRLGTSRAFNELFWFQTYPQMKANQLRKILDNFYQDFQQKDKTGMWHNAMLAGRYIGGTTMQGAITLMVMGLATAGLYGLKQEGDRAKEESAKFGFDALKAGMGGPLAILTRLAQNSKDSKGLTQNMVSLSPPVSAAQELMDAGLGLGRYEGRTEPERIGMFLESKTPGLELGKTLLSIAGLSQEDLEMKSAMKGFYAWRREQPNYKPASSGGADEADVAMRTQMKRVKEAVQRGGDWRKELEKVKDSVYAQHSLRAGTMLELNAKPLSEEQLASLEKRIGKKGVEKIQQYDTMLREIARELGEVGKEKKTVEEIKPVGDKYVDQTTSTQRGDRVAKLVKPKTLQFLEANKKKIPSFEPEYGLVGKKLMTKEQGERFEKLFAEELDKRLSSIMTNQVLMTKPLVKRQERIQDRIALAKEMAQVRFRAQERERQAKQ